MRPRDWHLITGEYPPLPGGVADYTAMIASALARSGQAVHVWTRGDSGTSTEADGVLVHRVAGAFRGEGLRRLSAALDATPGPRRLVIQYAPHAYGRAGSNPGFCLWLKRRRRAGDSIWTMFHEVQYVWYRGEPLRRMALQAISEWMARTAARVSSRIYVAIPAWEPMLRRYGPSAPMIWLPVPSNIPVVEEPGAVSAIRSQFGAGVTRVLASFGTYPPWMREPLRAVIPSLLDGHPERCFLLLGRGSDDFGREFLAAHPELAGRLFATGGLEPRVTSLHLQACDFLVLPYIDGVSTRRTTMMAALAHGKPSATTSGHLTEPFWSGEDAVRIVPTGDPSALRDAVERLASDPEDAARRGRAARALYESRFALERIVQTMLNDARAEDS